MVLGFNDEPNFYEYHDVLIICLENSSISFQLLSLFAIFISAIVECFVPIFPQLLIYLKTIIEHFGIFLLVIYALILVSLLNYDYFLIN